METPVLWGGPLGSLREDVVLPPHGGQSQNRKHWRYRIYEGHSLAVADKRIFGFLHGARPQGDHTWRQYYRGWGEMKLNLTG
jgi:hypothetical protein